MEILENAGDLSLRIDDILELLDLKWFRSIRSFLEFTVKHIHPDEKMTFAYLNKDEVPVLCGWDEWKEWWKREGDRCQVKYDRIDDWEIETRFKGLALLSTVHRSFGRSAFLVLESPLMELATSEPRNLRSRFMQRSSKGSSQENLKRNRRMNTCFLKASASSFHPMLIFAPDGLASRNGKTYRADCHCGDQASMAPEALKPGSGFSRRQVPNVQVFLVGGGDRDPLAIDEFAANVARAGSFKATELVMAPGADITQCADALRKNGIYLEGAADFVPLNFSSRNLPPPPSLASGSWRTSRSKVTSESPLVRDKESLPVSRCCNRWRRKRNTPIQSLESGLYLRNASGKEFGKRRKIAESGAFHIVRLRF